MPQNFGPTPATGQYYPAVLQGKVFRGGNQAVVAPAFTAGLTTTYTGGLILANPIASENNLVIQRVTAGFIIAQTNPAIIGLGVAVGVANITSPGTAVPSTPGNPGSTSTPSGILYSPTSATLPVALYLAAIIGTVNTGAETVAPDSSPLTLDLQGSIVLPPGGYACITSSATGTASSFFGSFTWLELPAGATA